MKSEIIFFMTVWTEKDGVTTPLLNHEISINEIGEYTQTIQAENSEIDIKKSNITDINATAKGLKRMMAMYDSYDFHRYEVLLSQLPELSREPERKTNGVPNP